MVSLLKKKIVEYFRIIFLMDKNESFFDDVVYEWDQL